LIDGFAVNPANQEVSMEAHKYLNNFEMPFVLVVFLVGVVMVLSGISSMCSKKQKRNLAFRNWYNSHRLMLLLNAGFNNTAYYPSIIICKIRSQFTTLLPVNLR
jgi:cytochrome d ubiquinol oxidase subunit II